MAETTSTIRVSNRRGIHIQAHENMLSAASEKSSMYKIQTSKARDPVNLTKSIGKRTKKKNPELSLFIWYFFIGKTVLLRIFDIQIPERQHQLTRSATVKA